MQFYAAGLSGSQCDGDVQKDELLRVLPIVFCVGYAVLTACRLAAEERVRAEIWLDCQHVVSACCWLDDDGPWECLAITAEVKDILMVSPGFLLYIARREWVVIANGIARQIREHRLEIVCVACLLNWSSINQSPRNQSSKRRYLLFQPWNQTKSNPFGAARPREEILAEKGLDWRKLETETDTKKSSSNSANSSRPSSAHSIPSEIQGTENVAIPVRPKVNPFGDAKPREVLLQERGQDWRKIDRELDRPRSIDRPETEEEKLLKQEISQLKEEYQKEQENKESAEGSDGDQSSLKDIITQKEKELETLTRDFDDKVRFSSPRPGSGAGRTSGFPDRPSSRSGSIDESRNAEFKDRPRSRGGAQDIWTRPGDERRSSFQGSRERPGDDRRSQQGSRDRGFLGSRDFDRPRSRDRW